MEISPEKVQVLSKYFPLGKLSIGKSKSNENLREYTKEKKDIPQQWVIGDLPTFVSSEPLGLFPISNFVHYKNIIYIQVGLQLLGHRLPWIRNNGISSWIPA